MNEHPNFKAKVVDDDGASYFIHFIGLFSQKKDAIPLMCIHGWPGKHSPFSQFNISTKYAQVAFSNSSASSQL